MILLKIEAQKKWRLICLERTKTDQFVYFKCSQSDYKSTLLMDNAESGIENQPNPNNYPPTKEKSFKMLRTTQHFRI